MEDEGLNSQLLRVGQEVLTSFVDLVPKLLVVLALVLAGLILGALAERMVRGGLRRAKINSVLRRLGLRRQAEAGDLETRLSSGISRATFVLILVIFLQSAADVLGLTAISGAISGALAFLPSLVGALVIAVLGALLARFLGGLVENLAVDSGIGYAPVLRQSVTFIVVFITLVMAVAQLNVDTEMIRSVARIAIAGAALGVALAFGLGTRDATRNLVAGFYLRKLLRPGEEIEASGCAGTLRAITPVQTVIEQAEGEVKMIENTVLLREVTRR